MTRILLIIFFLTARVISAQDKVFLRDGTSNKGVVISIMNDYVFFKKSDTSKTTYKIPKSDILMIERYDGRVFIYADKRLRKDSIKKAKDDLPKNYYGLQPLNALTGRGTICYERLNKTRTVGLMIPLSITYNPVGILYDSPDSSFVRTSGVNFIGGADLNFYVGKHDLKGFFLGPRIRYGTDMLLGNIEAYSLQTQFGWRTPLLVKGIYQHISFGFGFVRILSEGSGNRVNVKQSYGWGSINYRISFGN